MPHEEYIGWQEYYGLEPWGSGFIDSAQANIAALLANINRNMQACPKPFGIDEFLLLRQEDRAASTPVLLDDPDQQSSALMEAMFGGLPVIYAS